MSLLTWLTGRKTCSAVKCENNIIIEREWSIKAAEKDLGTTVVTRIEIQLVQLLSIVYVHWWKSSSVSDEFLLWCWMRWLVHLSVMSFDYCHWWDDSFACLLWVLTDHWWGNLFSLLTVVVLTSCFPAGHSPTHHPLGLQGPPLTLHRLHLHQGLVSCAVGGGNVLGWTVSRGTQGRLWRDGVDCVAAVLKWTKL